MAESDDLGSAIRWYVAAMAVAAVGALAVALAMQRSIGSGTQLAYGAVFGLAVLAAQWFPVHLTDKTKVYVDAAALTALALLLPAPVAAAIGAGAVAIHQWVIRPSVEQRVFNVAQTALYVLAGSLAFHAIAGNAFPPRFSEARDVAATVVCLLLMHAINTLSVAVIVAMQLGRQPLEIWVETVGVDLPEHVALVGFGVVLVAVAGSVPWLLALLPGPMVLVYLSLRRCEELRRATRATIEAIADLSDILGREVPGHSRRVVARTRQLAERLGLPEREFEVAVRAARLRGIGAIAGDGQLAGTVDDGDRSQQAARLAALVSRDGRVTAAVRHQTERWDGTGRPAGLAGTTIPVAARLVAVADAYERLAPFGGTPTGPTRVQAADVMAFDAGRAWDPAVVGALIEAVRPDRPGGA